MTRDPCQVRPAERDDAPFILSLVGRFTDFPLPAWRQREDCAEGVRHDLQAHLENPPPTSHLFVAEDGQGARVGFLHLRLEADFFSGKQNCHIADLAVATTAEGQGVGRALLAFADRWASEHDCQLLTLSVFPGNERALDLYRRNGFDTDMLRMARTPG